MIPLLFLALTLIELPAILLLEVVSVILLRILHSLLLLLEHFLLDDLLCALEDLKFDLAFLLVFLLLLGLKSLLEIQKLFFFRVEDGVDPVVYRSTLTHDLFISLRVEIGLSVSEQLILLLLPLQS